MSNKTEILSFDEWINGNGFNFRPEQYDLYKFLYESGQQSKQDEVGELRIRIDRIVGIITEAYKSGGNSSIETVYDKIQELLK